MALKKKGKNVFLLRDNPSKDSREGTHQKKKRDLPKNSGGSKRNVSEKKKKALKREITGILGFNAKFPQNIGES